MASKRNFSRVVEGTNRGDHCQSEVESVCVLKDLIFFYFFCCLMFLYFFRDCCLLQTLTCWSNFWFFANPRYFCIFHICFSL